MKAIRLSQGQRIQVSLNEPARLDQEWQLWFNQRWGFRSMLEVFDELSGTVTEDTGHDDITLHLSLFMIGGEPVGQAILLIPWDKIKEVGIYAKARVA
jgi:hypothetical protein